MFGFELFKQTTYFHACSLIDEGAFGEALPLLQNLIADGEIGEDVLASALCCALHLENRELAASYASQIDKNGYTAPDTLFWLADYHLGLDHTALGKRLLHTAIQSNPSDTGLLWDIANLWADYGFTDDSRLIIQKITAIRTSSPHQLLDQAEAFLALDNQAGAAAKAYEAAGRLPKDEPGDLLYAATILEQCQAPQKALEIYQTGSTAFPGTADFILGLVRCLVSLGDFTSAETALTLARAENPQLPGLETAARDVAKAKRKIINFQTYRRRNDN